MRKFIESLQLIVNNPPALYLIGTVIGVVSIGIHSGFKPACLVLGIWTFLGMIVYAISTKME